MKYKYLPHTADAKFVAYGNNIDEVLENCAIAMFNILGKTSDVKLIKKFEIELNKLRDEPPYPPSVSKHKTRSLFLFII